jgi:hypothetical protein
VFCAILSASESKLFLLPAWRFLLYECGGRRIECSRELLFRLNSLSVMWVFPASSTDLDE